MYFLESVVQKILLRLIKRQEHTLISMDRNEYQQIEELINDPSFSNWVHKNNDNDIVFWENWIKENPHHQQLVNDARDIFLGIQFSPTILPQEKVNSELTKLNNRITNTQLTKQISIFSKKKFWMSAAASVIFLMGAAAFLFWMNEPQTILHQTTFGETLELKLSDGTQVALNANSSIKYFKENPREVWLEGEAFFEVEKKYQSGEIFLVRTNDLTVEVLGTAFNVHTRKEKTEVLLEEGKVNLQLENGIEKEMKPGDLISFSAKSNQILENKKAVQPEKHTSWKDGSLLFENISLGEAMDRITEVYGVEVNFSNKEISKKRIHVGVPTTNLDICIKAMERSCGIKIKQNDNLLIIKEVE